MFKLKEYLKDKLAFMNGKYALWGDSNMQKDLAKYFATQDFRNDFLALTSGLSEKDIDCLTLIIGRLQKIYNHNRQYIFELTLEEKERLDYIHNVFQNKSIRLNKRHWFYENFIYLAKPSEITVFLDHCGVKELSNLTKIRNKNIIDVGASFGDSSIMLTHYTDKKVYAFEIEKNNYKLLQETIATNGLETKIIPINMGLSSSVDKYSVINKQSGSSLSKNLSNTSNFCTTTTLDIYVQENNIEVGLIKVDIEGHEMEFLKGAKKVIAEQKPSMIISIYHNVYDFLYIKPFLEKFLPNEYSFRIFKSLDYSIAHEIYLICEHKNFINKESQCKSQC